MADNGNLDRIWTHGGERVVCSGKLTLAGATVTVAQSDMPGITVSHPATGVYRITLPFKLPADASVKPFGQLQLAAYADSDVVVGPYSQANKTIDFLTATAGTAADITGSLNFEINFKNTGVTRP